MEINTREVRIHAEHVKGSPAKPPGSLLRFVHDNRMSAKRAYDSFTAVDFATDYCMELTVLYL